LDTSSSRLDSWQAHCTFGDGAAAVWVSSTCGSGRLAVEELQYRQQAAAGIDLIRFGYKDYYTFDLADEETFESNVRRHVLAALLSAQAGWKTEPLWAIHPAGISLLLRLSRGLGIPREPLQPSLDHYRCYSNMSSASILFILKEVASGAPPGAAINLLSMGAGFNVIYGRVRKEF
jgi:alkylresorcinol/alkylpyrone synthase